MVFTSNLISKFFFIGNSPYMPGTIASFIGLILWMLIPYNIYIRILIIICTWIIGHYSILAIIKIFKEVDPPSIVIDEVIGIWISCLFINDNMMLFCIAFMVFRYFDIMKPSFIYHAQNLKGSWGIMIDDVLAGTLTSILIIFLQV